MASFILATSITAMASDDIQDQRLLSNQSVLGTVWVRDSGEYDALCYQAYNSATNYLKDYLNTHKKDKQKFAVTLDLDETTLDNSAYAAWQAVNNKSYSSTSWARWAYSEKATAIPGVVAFTKFAKSHGVEVFYVSNRNVNLTEATIDNMKKLGLPYADKKHILPMIETSDKKERMDSIRDEGYKIILSCGDNIDDFDSNVYHHLSTERKEHVADTRREYGSKRIILPNPSYGSFEGAMTKDYWTLSTKDKIDARYKAITPWDGR